MIEKDYQKLFYKESTRLGGLQRLKGEGIDFIDKIKVDMKLPPSKKERFDSKIRAELLRMKNFTT